MRGFCSFHSAMAPDRGSMHRIGNMTDRENPIATLPTIDALRCRPGLLLGRRWFPMRIDERVARESRV
ncbi:MAG TPA: hypothetical protein VG328_22010 [Stellaceae bacterium]|jgi:hypothetical protein|nr:hypothetical protein [Stellaceae bacterium]